MAWLTGWDQRIKLTIDHTKIDAALSWFPVTVILSSTHGDCVFDELTADANRKKIAFTKTDGITQLYGEIEKWDDVNEVAIIHVSRNGWAISDSIDTDFYLYYDVDHADNTTYIGDIDSTPGATVWDSNFKLVCHMVDATTSTVKDSTSGSNDGTKKAANEPIEVDGYIGKAQDGDGTDDYIDVGTMGTFGSEMATNKPTVEVVFKTAITGSAVHLLGTWNTGATTAFPNIRLNVSSNSVVTTGNIRLLLRGEADHPLQKGIDTNLGYSDNQFHTLSVSFDGPNNTIVAYYDGVLQTLATQSSQTPDSFVNFGFPITTHSQNVRGTIQSSDITLAELRISNTLRSAAWVKATYNSLWDTLLTYGNEEVGGTGTMPIFMSNYLRQMGA